jgi:hypothetical protein
VREHKIRSIEYCREIHKKFERKQYNTDDDDDDDDDATVRTQTHIPMNGTQIKVCCW